jgi:hypothetical protein
MKKLSLSGLQLREPLTDGFQHFHLLQEGDHHLPVLFFGLAGTTGLVLSASSCQLRQPRWLRIDRSAGR